MSGNTFYPNSQNWVQLTDGSSPGTVYLEGALPVKVVTSQYAPPLSTEGRVLRYPNKKELSFETGLPLWALAVGQPPNDFGRLTVFSGPSSTSLAAPVSTPVRTYFGHIVITAGKTLKFADLAAMIPSGNLSSVNFYMPANNGKSTMTVTSDSGIPVVHTEGDSVTVEADILTANPLSLATSVTVSSDAGARVIVTFTGPNG